MDPTTLEDAFSVIHQELLTMMRILNKNAIGNDLPMSPLLKLAHEKLKLGDGNGCDMQTIGMTLHYSKPLRDHGVQYQLSTETGSDKLKLKVRFSALNEHERWDKIAHFMISLKLAGKFDVREFEFNSMGVGFTFYLDEKDNFDSLESILRVVEVASTVIVSGPSHSMDDTFIEKIDNSEKGLKPTKNLRLIVEQFEKDCGIISMMTNEKVIKALKLLVGEDPGFVEAILKKCWQNNISSNFINDKLPRLLLSAGHAENAVVTRALQFLNSQHSNLQKKGSN